MREINAFALPGGPMYLNRGMIEAAKTEGEVAGVMAHEISHVALRHGTAQATKGQKFQIGSGSKVEATQEHDLERRTQWKARQVRALYGKGFEPLMDESYSSSVDTLSVGTLN
jgi:predicted Zn-dependent protease